MKRQFKFLYYCRSDGVGFQYAVLSKLLFISEVLDLSVLVDWRQLSFVRTRNQEFSVDHLNRFFQLHHPRLIYDPEKIEEILIGQPHRVVGVVPGRIAGTPCPSASQVDFLSIEEICPDHGENFVWLSPFVEFSGELKNKFNLFVPIAKNSVGVHARLGNSEVVGKNEMRLRMDVSFERYFDEMDSRPNHEFLICTDTPSFLAACQERYGSRVRFVPRVMPEQGAGPGHRPGRGLAPDEEDGLQLFGESMLEMLLLGECQALICNKSLFTFHARLCRKVPTSMLENEGSTYALGWAERWSIT